MSDDITFAYGELFSKTVLRRGQTTRAGVAAVGGGAF